MLDNTPRGVDSAQRADRAWLFGDRELDPGGIVAAAVAAAMVAAGMILSGQADVASVAVAFVAVSALTLLNPRFGFLLAGAGLATWLAFVADMPGVTLVVGTADRRSRSFWCAVRAARWGRFPPDRCSAPSAWLRSLPALAALADRRRDRAVVAASGLTATALAEAASGRSLLFGRFAQVSGEWKNSASACVSDLLLPVLTSSTYLVALVVWVLGALMLGAIISRARGVRLRSKGPRSCPLLP